MQVEVNDEGDVGGGYQGQENLSLNNHANLTIMCVITYLPISFLYLFYAQIKILCLPFCFQISQTG